MFAAWEGHVTVCVVVVIVSFGGPAWRGRAFHGGEFGVAQVVIVIRVVRVLRGRGRWGGG